MADQKISELAEAASIGDSDELVVNDSGTTKKVQAVNAIPTGVAGDGLTGGGGSALAVDPDDSTLEIGAAKVRIKDDGVTLAKMDEGAFTHVFVIHVAQADNDATTGSYVLLLQGNILAGWATVGSKVVAKAFFSCDAGTGTGRITIVDTDDSGLVDIDTQTLTAGAADQGCIEVEIYVRASGVIYVMWKIFLINTQNIVETTANSGHEINGLNFYTFDGDETDQWRIQFSVNGSNASSMKLNYAEATFYPYHN